MSSDPDPDATPFNAALSSLAALKATLVADDEEGATPPMPPEPIEGALAPSTDAPYVLKGKIAVHKEKKGRAGKTATRISGLQLEPEGVAALAREMKRQLGCGAVVEDGDVVLLGDLAARAAEWLRAHGAKRVVGA